MKDLSMSVDYKQAKAVFLDALHNATPDEWDAFVSRQCGGDDRLRKHVRELLSEHASAGQMATNLIQAAAARISTAEGDQSGSFIGPYRLLEKIGEGGMGVVYMAQQVEPVKRKVALKIIKPGMDSKAVIARFEAERQALALMDHPNIAKILDAGTVGPGRRTGPDAEPMQNSEGGMQKGRGSKPFLNSDFCILNASAGRPYFVMELVRGIPITDYCDQARLRPRARLELFIDVCHAVQHAHQKGIIHRDLKPSNVMVTLHDGKPVVKVIDFGVAKAIGAQLTDRTIHTAHTQLVGTPLYMSPEQAELSGLDVDTRSDVYSLGVLLYELLTARTPFDQETLSKAGFDEMRRIIREDAPPKPSHRVSTLNAKAFSTVSQHRGLDERRLSQTLRGELDWIVMKSLEKDRNRRYESAIALAADVRRYLGDEPVQACPPSLAYRFQKLTRKHRMAIATVAITAATLLIATAVSIGQAIDANQARQIADDRLSGEQKARREAEQSRREAEAQRDRADRERLRAESERERAESERLRAESERKRVESEQLRAQRNLETALDAVDRLLAHVGAWDVSGVPFLPAPILKRIRSDGIELYERLLADSDNAPEVRHALAKFQVTIGHSGESNREAQLKSCVATLEELTEADPQDRKYQQSLAMAYSTLGSYYWQYAEPKDFEKAADFKHRASQLFAELAVANVPATEFAPHQSQFSDLHIHALLHLSRILSSLERSSEADDKFREAEKLAEQIKDPLSDARASLLKMRADRIAKSAPEQADDLYLAAMEINRRRIAEGIVPGGWSQHFFANQLIRFAGHTRIRKPAAAERALDEALGVLRRIIAGLGNASYRYSFTEAALIQAQLLLAKEEPDATAEAKTLEERRRKAAASLAEALIFANQIREEYPDDQRYVKRITELTKLQTQHFGLIASLKADIDKATKLGNHEAVELAARKLLAACEEQLGKDHSDTLDANHELAWALFRQGKFVASEPYFRRWVNWSEKVSPESWETFNRKSMLGEYLIRAAGELQTTDSAAAKEMLVEAERLLLTSHQGIKAQYDKIPTKWKTRLPESIERLVQLYKAWNKPVEAARWQAELQALGDK